MSTTDTQPTGTPRTVGIESYAAAQQCYRNRDLRQGSYDEGDVVMADVVINLHGAEHRNRRRLENRLFRRDTFWHYEQDLFPAIFDETLAPHLAAGRTELVRFGHQLMMNLAALTAGVDRPEGTPTETFRLYDYLMLFIEGATIAHHTGDKEAKSAEVHAALQAFGREFLAPGIRRRQHILDRIAAGTAADGELPPDVLSVLVRNQDNLDLTPEIICREVAFYLLAGAHTSATAFTRTMHNIFSWLEAHPEAAERPRTDRLFCQRATHETIRLQPSSPVAVRWAEADITLADGTLVRAGDKVVIDLPRVNRDPAVFGTDADDFNPQREVTDGAHPWGLSFGMGMHACIGQDLAAGVVLDPESGLEGHLFGVTPVAVQTMFDHGCVPDPDDPPQMDPSTTRPYFGRYPVIFTRNV
ncbi:MAG: cytochrome P450 [Acidimicrobiia bacterium]|nr:cytochrome P450 [Acidimicrobiia bacterium]